MGDLLLDLRPRQERRLEAAAAALRFVPELQVGTVETNDLGLIVTFSAPGALWAPHVTEDGSVFATAGMPAFDDDPWRDAEAIPGAGGLAAKAIRCLYNAGGVEAVERTSGNFGLVIFDAPTRKLYLVADRAGAFPLFECRAQGHLLLASHPDVLARIAGVEHDLDEISLAEFLIASTVTPPFSFYGQIRAIDPGTVLAFDLASGEQSRRRYFSLEFSGDDRTSEQDLAAELAHALKASVRRRTLARLGKPVIALSGGLDSRLLLASVADPTRALAFTCYDQPNRELQVAARLASAIGVPFLPLQRSPDYYAENAELGVRVSGGMGTFANNHFLGVLRRLQTEGMGVMLTGCYCDYLFKGLPLNRRTHWLTGRERLAPFSYQFYFSRRFPSTPLAHQVRQRWDARFPDALRAQDSDAKVFDLEVRRTFPLCYEGDNQQRVVPQRLVHWALPASDRQVLDVYRRIPSRMKLNRSLFSRTARILLADSPALRVPDANTGAPLNASPLRHALSANWLRLKRRIANRRPALRSDGSWPNWQYYLAHSPKLAELWHRPNPEAFGFFRRVMGWSSVPRAPQEFEDGRVFLFVALLTQKLWFEQRETPSQMPDQSRAAHR
jgi:asparagine synthase (glutamine-hydrolysing)